MSIEIFILAGGKSSRMGEDKGFVPFLQKPMIENVLDTAKQLSPHITILTSNTHYKQFGFPIHHDLIPNIGPAGAIYSALHQSKSELNIMLTCDMPFVDTHSILTLLRDIGTSDICISRHEEYIEPFPGIYKTCCLPQWEHCVEHKILKLQDILTKFTVKFTEANRLLPTNPKLYENINTKSELDLHDSKQHGE
jgi:molybdopterin-guanine dinucleotide biosynthesis protein A